MTERDALQYWLDSAEDNRKIALDLFRLKHFAWSLYLGQLSLEKILKGLLVKKELEPLHSHDLVKLAKVTEIELTTEAVSKLNEITTFNIEARYDDYKLSFHLKATEQFATKWLKVVEEFYRDFVGKIKND